jgi:hypothetical protein
MSTFEAFVKKVRKEYGVNPLLPFGTPIEPGVIGTMSGGKLTRRGSVESILKKPLPPLTSSRAPANWGLTSGKSVSVGILASGKSSNLFPDLAAASVRAEISFGGKGSYVLSAKDVVISTVADPASLMGAILAAYGRKEWEKDFILINEVATPGSVFAALSHSGSGGVLLNAKGNLNAGPVDIAGLAANFQVTAKTSDAETYESGGQPLFFNALRIRSKWLSGATVLPFAREEYTTEDIFAQVTYTPSEVSGLYLSDGP